MLDLTETRYVTRRFHSSRPEQENGLSEQGRAELGHSECTACDLQQRHHVAGGLFDFVGAREGWRRWPTNPRPLDPYLLDERPEAHQERVLIGFAGRQDGAMTKQACEVEIPRRNTSQPFANSLARYAGQPGDVAESRALGRRNERGEDVRHTIHLAGQGIVGQDALKTATVRVLALRQDDLDTAIIVPRCLEPTTDPRVGELQILAATFPASTARKNRRTAPRDVLEIPGRLHRKYVDQHAPRRPRGNPSNGRGRHPKAYLQEFESARK